MTDPMPARLFDLSRRFDERTLRQLGAPIGSFLWREHAEGIRQLQEAVTAAGYQFYGDQVQITFRFAYVAEYAADGTPVQPAESPPAGSTFRSGPGRTYVVGSIADVTAPTAAELAAGHDITAAVEPLDDPRGPVEAEFPDDPLVRYTRRRRAQMREPD